MERLRLINDLVDFQITCAKKPPKVWYRSRRNTCYIGVGTGQSDGEVIAATVRGSGELMGSAPEDKEDWVGGGGGVKGGAGYEPELRVQCKRTGGRASGKSHALKLTTNPTDSADR